MKTFLKTFLAVGSLVTFGLAVLSAFRGDAAGFLINMTVSVIMDLQYKHLVLDEKVDKLLKEGKNGTESTQGS